MLISSGNFLSSVCNICGLSWCSQDVSGEEDSLEYHEGDTESDIETEAQGEKMGKDGKPLIQIRDDPQATASPKVCLTLTALNYFC